MFRMYINNIAFLVNFEIDFCWTVCEVCRVFFSDVLLYLLDLMLIKGIVNGFPKSSISDMSLDIFLLGILVLHRANLTMKCSIIYSLEILPYWKWGSTTLIDSYQTYPRIKGASLQDRRWSFCLGNSRSLCIWPLWDSGRMSEW